ncbi:tetraspanin-18-like [Saccostrea echinata]|uniref:tetraspanin-18-like n=1 Tax=Saccostrea echinata TaxID=191078 RepID=UPI002A828052|nr:tetraspanin-18-like [Saccostrea echinata]
MGHVNKLTILVIVLASLLVVFGIVVMVSGILEQREFISDKIKPAFDSFPTKTFIHLMHTKGAMVIGFGSFTLVCGLLLSCAVGCRNDRVMYTFVVLCGLLALLTLGYIAVLYLLQMNLKKEILKTLSKNYKDDNLKGVASNVSNAWNNIFLSWDCCGVNPVVGLKNDFGSTSWCSEMNNCRQNSSPIPKTCCNHVTAKNYTRAPPSCYRSVTKGFNKKVKVCYEVFQEKYQEHFQEAVLMAIMIPGILLELAAQKKRDKKSALLTAAED